VIQTLGIQVAEVTKVLGLATRTMARRRDRQVLTPVESDRLYRFARVACLQLRFSGRQRKHDSGWNAPTVRSAVKRLSTCSTQTLARAR